MKKIVLILIMLLCIGCSNTVKKVITKDEAYAKINEMFHYDENIEEYSMEYYKKVTYKVNNKENYYYAFLITSKTSNFSYYVLIDTYGETVLNPVSKEDME